MIQSLARRAARRVLAAMRTHLSNWWAVRRLRSGKPRVIVHNMPDVSGGAATWVVCCADALPEYSHLIVTNRPVSGRIRLMLSERRNLTVLNENLTPENIRRALPFEVAAVFNHMFWDLRAVEKDWLPDPRPPIVSFMHARESMGPHCLGRADFVVVFSRHLEDPGLEKLFSPEVSPEVVFLPNCMNEVPFVRMNLRAPRRDGLFVVGNITNGAPWKHSDDFLQLCRDFTPSDVRFRFLGAVDLRNSPHDDLPLTIIPPFTLPAPEYLAGVSVLIHRTATAFVETWCRVVTEAMFAGVPVIAERKGGIRDQIVHGETGFLCDTRSDFVECLKALHSDDALYQRIASKAREEAVNRFSLKKGRENLLLLVNSR